MKNILTYLNPDKEFNDEHKMAVKIQIDNSLSLGWKPEDILLVTNFPYEYNGIKSIIIGDENYCTITSSRLWSATKIYATLALFDLGLIKDSLYWYHDFDCFELNRIIESEIKEEMESCNLGLSNYGQKPRLCSASIFFDKNARDIFQWVKDDVNSIKQSEERSFSRLYYGGEKRIKRINTTYAFHKFNVVKTYKTTIKPIRVAHFHLTPDKYDFYVRGNNKLNMPLVPKRLVKIFNKHGFTG